MTKRRSTRRQPMRRQRQQPRRQRRQYQNRAVLPPATTLYGHIMRTIVQTAWDIAQGALTAAPGTLDPSAVAKPSHNGTKWSILDVDNGWLLAQQWLDRFKGLFMEMKVHSITAHYMPYESTLAVGEYVFGLWDYGQDVTPSSFSAALGMPSSVVRKNGQPAKLVWYPTEPDDRNWVPLASDHKWCSCVVYQAEDKYNVDQPGNNNPLGDVVGVQGKIVIELNASFRGKPNKPTPGYDAPSGSPEFLQYQRDHPCTCRKCIPRILRRLRDDLDQQQELNSSSASPYLVMDCGAPT